MWEGPGCPAGLLLGLVCGEKHGGEIVQHSPGFSCPDTVSSPPAAPAAHAGAGSELGFVGKISHDAPRQRPETSRGRLVVPGGLSAPLRAYGAGRRSSWLHAVLQTSTPPSLRRCGR